MRVLVAGRTGQVARALAEATERKDGIALIALGRPDLDLEQSGSIAEAVARVRPDVVINAAAYTAVDKAEDEPELAHRINANAAGELARAAHDIGAAIIQLSTDYVFDGAKQGVYVEDDPVGPIGVYGRSKLAGEEQVRAANPQHLILRTAWVYSPFGHNFVKTMLRLAGERSEVAVVDDQCGSPTSALDLSEAILNVVEAWNGDRAKGAGKTYHLGGSGSCRWAEFAEEIFRISASLGGPTAAVRRIGTREFPTRARRPANSRLDSGKFERTFGCAMPPWQVSLAGVVRRLVRER